FGRNDRIGHAFPPLTGAGYLAPGRPPCPADPRTDPRPASKHLEPRRAPRVQTACIRPAIGRQTPASRCRRNPWTDLMSLALFLVPLALSAALAVPAIADDDRGPGTITIQGHGEVTGAPDTAFITSGVTTQGATAREALDANTRAMTELIDTLKAAGIEARDIQTSGFSVSPNYVYSDERDANGYTMPPKINGYQVFNTVTVRVRQLTSLGDVLDKAVTVGANTINGVSFSMADPSALYNEARKLAFADARDK